MLVPPEGRCKTTISPMELDNVTNKGYVTIANSNRLSGNSCCTDLVRKTFKVAPPQASQVKIQQPTCW